MTLTRLFIITVVLLLGIGYGCNWLAAYMAVKLQADRAAVELSIDE